MDPPVLSLDAQEMLLLPEALEWEDALSHRIMELFGLKGP